MGRKDATEATPLLSGSNGGGHGHSHASKDHGHSHASKDHGHSHGGDDSHGHSHGGAVSIKKVTSAGKLQGADCDDGNHRTELPQESSATKQRQKTSLAIGVAMCCAFMLIEIVGGYLAHSLAIMTDAAHLLTDVGALSLSFFAIHISEQSSCSQYTFGWHRAEIIGALTSIFSIWFLTGIILFEAFNRMLSFYRCASLGEKLAAEQTECIAVDGKLMTVVGVLGLMVNLTLAGILLWGGAKVQHAHSHGGGACPSEAAGKKDDDLEHGGHGHSHAGDDHGHSHGGEDGANVNVQSAYLHALGDCINSLGVIIAAFVIWYGNSDKAGSMSVSSWYNLADPVASVFFGVITLFTTWGLTKEVLAVLMEGVPQGVNYDEVKRKLENVENVEEVHDLHIWALTTDKLSLSAHLMGDTAKHSEQILHDAQEICTSLRPRSITHTTFQIDPKDNCCAARCFSNVH